MSRAGVLRRWWWRLQWRTAHAVGLHDPWCRGRLGLSCDPMLRPDLWMRR